MTRTLKWIGIGIAGLIVLLLLVLAFFPWNSLRGTASSAISADLHRPVHIAALHGSLFWHPHIEVRGFTIGNPQWAGGGQMVSVQRIDLDLAFWPLFRGEIVLPKVALTRPVVRLYRTADGRANWIFTAHPTKAKQKANQPMHLPLVHRLVIEQGRLTARDEMHRMTFDGTVVAGSASGAAGVPSPTAKAAKAQARSRGASPSRARQQASRVAANTGTGFELLGQGALNHKPFTLRVSGGPLIWAETHKPYPFDVRMIASDIRANARGVLPRPFDLDQLDVRLSLAGDDLADGYYLTGLALPNTPPYSISGRLRLVGTKYEFTHVRGRLGGSDIHGVVTVGFNAAGTPVLNADLASHALNLADLGPTFGGAAPSPAEEAQESHATGHPSRAAVKHAVNRKVTHEVTGKTARKAAVSRFLLPTSKLQVNRLRGMQATLHYRADEVKAQSMPLRKVDVRLRLRNDVLRIDPFEFTFPEGDLAGTAVIDVRHSVPAEQLDVRLTRVQLGQFHAKGTTRPPFEGTLVGRLKVHGTGDSMHAFASTADGTLSMVVPHGEIEQAFAEFAGIDVARGLDLLLKKKQKQTAVRCGIADFQARHGIVKVRQVVFDTQPVIVTGLGDVNLRNERIKLQLTGAPKKFRLAVLRTPIEIRGTLRHPAVGVKGSKLLAQGAAATVLGAIGTPIAAIAAFVDPGLNKSADCRALLTDARSLGAPVRTAAIRRAPKGKPR